jgi:glycosyltransferase involved in cell wall biosynthesis
MIIGIDIRAALGNKTGKGWYVYNIVKELLAIDKKNEYLLYTDKITPDLVVFGGSNIRLIHKNRWAWHFAVIKDFKKNNGEIFFAPTSFIIPAFLPNKIKSVITVHDLVSFIHPHLHQTKATILEHLFFRMALKKSMHVLVPSKSTKEDLIQIFNYPSEKITVTPLAANGMTKGTDPKTVKEKYKLPDNFILAVSGLEPRKNISALVDTIHNTKLVIVGGKGWKSNELQKKIANAGDKIIHIENCPPEDLPAFYKLAKVLVYPSLYEGFGLPPLEAMANGCPVICSNTSSLPEVCGDAAIYINPKNTKEIENAITELLNNEKLRLGLIEKGFAQAEKFSWRETTAKLTLKSFDV